MKKLSLLILAFAMLTGVASAAPYVAGPYSAGRNYTCQTTSVTSSSVPVNVLPAAVMTTFTIHVRSTGANPVLIFPYAGSLPGSAPTNVMERAAGSDWSDAISCGAPECLFAIGQAYGAVLATGSTAVTVDACYR